jgi:hypothetical protein
MNNEKLKIVLCVGLPGSGKTYFLKNNYPNDRSTFDEDYEFLSDDDKIDVVKTVGNRVKSNFQYLRIYNELKPIIIDCLITTNSELNKVIDRIYETSIKEGVSDRIHFVIHFWKENRELCLYNDKGRRREKSSEISIRNLPLEYPTVNNSDIDYEIIEHDVIAAPSLNIYFNKYKDSQKNDFILTSESWSAGGSWGNCWGGSGTISPDPVPQSFKEFDEMLEKLCPDISFMTYKKLYNETVTIEERSENDYYGGTEYRHNYKCDLEKLHKLMVELNIIEP